MLHQVHQRIDSLLKNHLPMDQLLDNGRQNRFARVVVDHVDDLRTVCVRQLVEVVVKLLLEDLFRQVHALGRHILDALLVVLVVEDLELVLVEKGMEFLEQR